MSVETWEAVENALRAHLADSDDSEPWLMTSWYAVCAATDGSMQRTSYFHVCSDQSIHMSLGLVEMARIRLRRMINPWVEGEEPLDFLDDDEDEPN
jgi:hypothetical protein